MAKKLNFSRSEPVRQKQMLEHIPHGSLSNLRLPVLFLTKKKDFGWDMMNALTLFIPSNSE